MALLPATVRSHSAVSTTHSPSDQGGGSRPCTAGDLSTLPSEHLELCKSEIEARLAFVEHEIEQGQLLKSELVQRRVAFVKELERRALLTSPMVKLPWVYLAEFLGPFSLLSLAATSCSLRAVLYPPEGLILPHLHSSSVRCDLGEDEARGLAQRLCFSSVQSMHIDARNPGARLLLVELVTQGTNRVKNNMFTNLTALTVNASADQDLSTMCLVELVKRLVPRHKLLHLHLSGLRQIEIAGRIVRKQCRSLQSLRLDYFVGGHETELGPRDLPPLPNIKSLWLDVADLTSLPVTLLLSRLAALTRPELLEVLYLPHVQLYGCGASIVELVNGLDRFERAKQVVLRFVHLPLSVRQVVDLRHGPLAKFPAVCVSDHFVVAMDTWASWWPPMASVWAHPSMITGMSVFREQVDFESFGTSAVHEWLLLSREQRALWEGEVVDMVRGIYTESVDSAEEDLPRTPHGTPVSSSASEAEVR